jgi:transposase-like protein
MAQLGYEKGDPAGRGTRNIRTGYSGKTPKSRDGSLEIEVPRDRQGSLEPQLLPKGETRFDGAACPRTGRRPDPQDHSDGTPHQ